MIKPISKKKYYETISEQIEQAILSGEWAEGSRVPTEDELAGIFQVGRGSIREAITNLQMSGVLNSSPGIGTYVADNAISCINNHQLADMLNDPESLNDMVEARQILEPQLAAYAAEHGNEALHERLRTIDPVSYETIHPNNLKRVIRALEYYKETGMTISAHNEAERQRETPYDLHFFVLNDDRAVLYDRIDRRVDFMMAEGLYDEVLYLRQMGLTRDMVSMQGLGYKEMLDCMDGRYDLDEAVQIMEEAGSIDYARNYAENLTSIAKNRLIDMIAPSPSRDMLISMADWFVSRLS